MLAKVDGLGLRILSWMSFSLASSSLRSLLRIAKASSLSFVRFRFLSLGHMLTGLADAPESATDLTANSANPLGVEQIWWQVHFSLFDGLRLLGSNVDRSMSMQLSFVEVAGHGVFEGHVNLPSP